MLCEGNHATILNQQTPLLTELSKSEAILIPIFFECRDLSYISESSMISGISGTAASHRDRPSGYNKAMLVEIAFLGKSHYQIDAYLRKEGTTTESDIPTEKLDWSK